MLSYQIGWGCTLTSSILDFRLVLGRLHDSMEAEGEEEQEGLHVNACRAIPGEQ